MNGFLPRSGATALLAPLLATGFAIGIAPGLAAQVPGDTHFSLSVTDGSHNHAGARRLFLDFQEAPFSAPDPSVGQVVAVEVAPGAITLDGDAGEWDPTYVTTVAGLVQNNYPLSEFLDAVPVDIEVGAAWDATHVWFVVRWEDAGHAASTRWRKWIFGDQGLGQAGWNPAVHAGATPGAPNAAAVNADHVLAGREDEDRLFLLFPIVDTEQNFAPDGPGCAFYCHINLDQDDADQNYTGAGVAVMRTNVPGDTADVWHWKSTRSAPSGFVDDQWIEYAVGAANGRRNDAGSAASDANGLTGDHPTLMHLSGLGFSGDVLLQAEAVPYAGARAPGDEIPAVVSVPATGSRGDVTSTASFDPVTNRWTVELMRLRDTGQPDDHSFDGAPSAPSTAPLTTVGDPVAGALAYAANCQGCHQPQGAGLDDGSGNWVFPRVQRTSGSHVVQAIYNVPIMAGLETFVSEQDVEDIAAYLQAQASFDYPVFTDPTPCGETLSVFVGSPVAFTARATDVDPLETVTLAASGVPAGASFTPSLPSAGNPVSADFAWTPTNADVGTHVIALTATDGGGLEGTCEVTVEVLAECYLVLGDGSGTVAPFIPTDHAFYPQIGIVEESFPVLMTDIPAFVIPDPAPLAPRPFTSLADFADPYGPVEFHAQVLMWNPVQFPGEPEQHSRALHVTVLPDGSVFARRYGDTTGISITYEVGTDALGRRVIRFPFVVPGM